MKDGETDVAAKALEKMSSIDENGLSDADKTYLSNIKNLAAGENAG